MSTDAGSGPNLTAVVQKIVAVLHKSAAFELPPGLDRRYLEMGERKDFLSVEEREELLAWAKLTQEHLITKEHSQAALHQLVAAFPGLMIAGETNSPSH